MAKTDKTPDAKAPKATGRPEARLPKGMRDVEAPELIQQREMIEKIRAVYERYGFEPLETPAFEYTEALGKFLPDQDRPNEGVFSFTDEDDQWLSLRYDLTAPLARYYAENQQRLPKPFRRYAVGPVWRNEKPGPGRFRQFLQFDADTVGAESVAADAEMCMLAADTMEALGFKSGEYVIKVNNRKIFDGLREAVGLSGADKDAQWLAVMRAIDKLDRFGAVGVLELLGKGRRDDSGDFTPGAGLEPKALEAVGSALGLTIEPAKFAVTLGKVTFHSPHPGLDWLGELQELFPNCEILATGARELSQIQNIVALTGYGADRIVIDRSVVRGLEYYTGPVFEAELTFPITNDDGETVRFGSVGGGGRYDDLVARFTGERVPATGFSIGVSRLQAALAARDKHRASHALGPVVVTVMDKAEIAHYQSLVQTLRNAGVRAELYLGNPKKFGRQLEYADKRNSPVAVIQGSNERTASPPQVILKDLIEGAKAAAAIKDNREWKEARPAQVTVPEADLVAEVRKILARHGG